MSDAYRVVREETLKRLRAELAEAFNDPNSRESREADVFHRFCEMRSDDPRVRAVTYEMGGMPNDCTREQLARIAVAALDEHDAFASRAVLDEGTE